MPDYYLTNNLIRTMCSSMTIRLLCLILLTMPVLLCAQPEGHLADRSTDWLYFDTDRESYLPFLPDVQGPQPVLHLRLEADVAESYDVLIRLDSGTAVFENSDLHSIAAGQNYFRLSLDARHRVRLLSIWQEGKRWKKAPPTYLVRPGTVLPEETQRSPGQQHSTGKTGQIKRPTWIPDTLVLLTWGMFLLVVGLRQGDTSIFKRTNFGDSIGALYKPLGDAQRLDTITAISFFLYYVTIVGYFLTVWRPDFANFLAAFADNTLQVTRYTVLRLVGLLGLSRLYFASSETGWLHIRELMRLSLPIIAVLFVTGVLLGLGQGGFASWIPTDVFRWQLIALLLLRTFLLCYQIFRLQKTVNFYLFSYLCSTEIIPAFFVMQYILTF